MKVRDITNLATRAIFNTKVTEIENKIPDITGSLTTPGFNRLTKICFDARMKEATNILASKSQVDSGHLKTPGTQMGYPNGVLIWVVIKINDQTVFWSILASQRRFNSFTSLSFYI